MLISKPKIHRGKAPVYSFTNGVHVLDRRMRQSAIDAAEKVQLPFAYDPKENCPLFEDLLLESLSRDDYNDFVNFFGALLRGLGGVTQGIRRSAQGPAGMILAGPPGCGKTILMRLIMSYCRASEIIRLQNSDLGRFERQITGARFIAADDFNRKLFNQFIRESLNGIRVVGIPIIFAMHDWNRKALAIHGMRIIQIRKPIDFLRFDAIVKKEAMGILNWALDDIPF